MCLSGVPRRGAKTYAVPRASVRKLARIYEKKWCPGWESNPHEEKSPEDFKSSASAIPPPGHWHYKVNESKDLVQHRQLGYWPLKNSGVGGSLGWSLCRGVQPRAFLTRSAPFPFPYAS